MLRDDAETEQRNRSISALFPADEAFERGTVALSDPDVTSQEDLLRETEQ